MTNRSFAIAWMDRTRDGIVFVCRWLAVLALAGLLGVVSVNVGARLVFDLTSGGVNFMMPGAIELSAYLLLVTVFSSLPTALGTAMIRVDTFIHLLPVWAQRLLDRLWGILLAVVAIILIYLFAKITMTAMARNFTTQDLRVPLYLIYGFVTIQCVALSIVSICEFFSPTRAGTEVS